MATTTQAKKTSQAARKTSQAAKRTTREAKTTTKQAERTARTLVADGVYAAVGVGDTAVALVRRLPDHVGRIRTQVPKTVETGVKRVLSVRGEDLKTRAAALRTSAGKELDGYVHRGQSVIDSVSRAAATRRALDQTRAARSQVKAARTSVRKAFGQSVEAVETAADKVGEEQPAAG